MNQPVKLGDNHGYPTLAAAFSSPHGDDVSRTPSNLVGLHGGPTFGMGSVSEPNTSPDVIVVACVFASYERERFLPSGTPVALSIYTPRPIDHHGEAVHMCDIIAGDERSDDDFGEACETSPAGKFPFITVTVGDVTVHKKMRHVHHIAVAIQNVATIHVPDHHKIDLDGVAIGDRLLLACPYDFAVEDINDDGPTVALFRTTAFMNNELASLLTDRDDINARRVKAHARIVTVVAPLVGNLIQCDLGETLKMSPVFNIAI